MIQPGTEQVSTQASTAHSRGSALSRQLLASLLKALGSFVIVLAAWVAFLKIFRVSTFVGKGPLDVWDYLFSSPLASSNRVAIFHESAITLRDASLGLVGGTISAVAAAMGFHVWKLASRTFMPIAMTLRSVPLVAMAPLIVGVFGQNLLAITVIGGIVTFFPTLVNVVAALDGAPAELLDLCHAYGATSQSALLKVQLPAALPALFASIRISAPLALVGALLAEWLATGKGLGYTMLTAGAQSNYDGVWARVAVSTTYAVILYVFVGTIERRFLSRFALDLA